MRATHRTMQSAIGLSCLAVVASCLFLLRPAAAEGPPSNRNDKFMFGYYGGIRKGESLQPGSGLDAVTCYQMVRNYGVDWLWMQNQSMDKEGKLRDSVLELKKQVRIILRVTWWRNPAYADKYFPKGRFKPGQDGWDYINPDWIDLADDPEALKTALRIMDQQPVCR